VDTSHIEGFGHAITDVDTSHIEGNEHTVSTAGGTTNHIEGSQHTVTGNVKFAHVEGNHCSGMADTIHVQGDSASGIRETQFARASGKFAAVGDAQASFVTMRGSSPGAAPNENVELKYGGSANQNLTLENGKAYAFKIRVIAYATDTNFASFESSLFAANQEGGVITIKPAPPVSVPLIAGTAGASTWTITVDVGAGPTRIKVTFATGVGTTSAARIAADIEFVEVARA
jgi:hypothetical protein